MFHKLTIKFVRYFFKTLKKRDISKNEMAVYLFIMKEFFNFAKHKRGYL